MNSKSFEKQHSNSKNTSGLIYFLISVVIYIFVFIFTMITSFNTFSNYGFKFDIKPDVELTPIKAHEEFEGSWNKKNYVGPNGGVGTNSKGYHPIHSVYIDFKAADTGRIISIKADDIYGVANLKKCQEIVKEGNTITRNLYYRPDTNELLGISRGGNSVINFYAQNATGLCVLLVVFVITTINTIISIVILRRK